jgi:hypothetical protein
MRKKRMRGERENGKINGVSCAQVFELLPPSLRLELLLERDPHGNVQVISLGYGRLSALPFSISSLECQASVVVGQGCLSPRTVAHMRALSVLRDTCVSRLHVKVQRDRISTRGCFAMPSMTCDCTTKWMTNQRWLDQI